MLKVGDQAPDFKLPDQNGVEHSLSEFLQPGKKLLLYFYPKDNTPGCTIEANNFKDDLAELKKLNLNVVGISKDSVKSHTNFADKYQLNFPILSDEDLSTIKAYGVYGKKKFMGKEYDGVLRTSFLIGEDGKIEKVYEGVNPKTHVEEIKADIA